MEHTIQRVSLKVLAGILFVAATGFLVAGATIALAQAVGTPLACALVAIVLALVGGGILLGMRHAPRRRTPPASAEALVTSALGRVAAIVIIRMLRPRS